MLQQRARRLFIRITLLVAMIGTGLGLGYATTAAYFLVSGGPERVRQELSGEIATTRRATGQRPPTSQAFLIFITPMVVGFGLGVLLWKIAARRVGLDEDEIASVLRR